MGMPLIGDLILTITLIVTLFRSRSGLMGCVFRVSLFTYKPAFSP